MFIDFEKDNIDFITSASSIKIDDPSDNPGLDELIVKISSKDLKKTRHFSWYDEVHTSYGIWFGTNKDISDILNSKLTDEYLSNKVYVDKLCNIPTFDLQEKGITRKRSCDTADICIVPEPKFKIARSFSKIIPIYSESENKYLIICDLSGFTYGMHKWTTKFFEYIRREYSAKQIVDVLKDWNLIPEDSGIVEGEILFAMNAKELDFFRNLDKYHDCVYQNEYQIYLSQDKDPLDTGMISTISEMLKSKETDTVDMGLQLLYSFDPRPYAYTISIMLMNVASRYFSCQLPFYNSTKFDKYLSLINLSKKDLRIGVDHMRHKTFDICGPDDQEKIVREIMGIAKEYYNNAVSKIQSYQFLKETTDIINPKFIYNEKDYFDRGE